MNYELFIYFFAFRITHALKLFFKWNFYKADKKKNCNVSIVCEELIEFRCI